MLTEIIRPLYLTCALTAVFLVLSVAGCGPSSRPPATSTPSATSTGGSGKSVDEAECEQLIRNAIQQVQPQSLGIETDRETAISLLNRWRDVCAAPLPENWDESLTSNPVVASLPEETLSRLQRENFGKRDALQYRNCVWNELVARRIAEESGPDATARAVNLFYFAVRNITLAEAGERLFSLDPFDTTIIGRGTPEDRAWLFAALLRPLRLDAVIIRPANAKTTATEPADNSSGDQAAATKSERFLVGVIVGNGVLLFDPFLGIPIPADGSAPQTALPRNPATLREARENKEILALLDLEDSSYPFQASDLKEVRVEIVGNSTIWAGRSMQLQEALTGDRAVMVFDGLQDGLWGKGVVSRVMAASEEHWDVKDIGIWDYPEIQLQAYEDQEYEEEKFLEQRMRPFDVPIPIVGINPETIALEFGPPQRQQLRARNSQLRGEYSPAIKSYLSIRLWGNAPPFRSEEQVSVEVNDPAQPFAQQGRKRVNYISFADYLNQRIRPEARQTVANQLPREMLFVHGTAALDATFWGGVCQLEQGKFDAAATSLAAFLGQFPESYWTPTATYLYAVSLAEDSKLEEGLKVLNDSLRESSLAPAKRVLAQRWQEILEARPRTDEAEKSQK